MNMKYDFVDFKRSCMILASHKKQFGFSFCNFLNLSSTSWLGVSWKRGHLNVTIVFLSKLLETWKYNMTEKTHLSMHICTIIWGWLGMRAMSLTKHMETKSCKTFLSSSPVSLGLESLASHYLRPQAWHAPLCSQQYTLGFVWHTRMHFTHTHTKQRRFADRYTQTENTHTHPFSVHTVCACIVCGGGGRKKEIKWFGIGRIDEKGRTP